MPIYIYPDRIEFPNYSLRIDSTGVRVTTPTVTKTSGTFTTVGSILTIANQGVTRGYASGGANTSFSTTLNVIDQYPFATNANATDVGDLTQIRQSAAGASSSVSGYSSGGFTPPPTVSNVIDKFPFAANANATDVGDLTQIRGRPAGQSSSVSGYSSGGFIPLPVAPMGPYRSDRIDKFPFSTNANATTVGNLSQMRGGSAAQSSLYAGYTSGGDPNAPAVNTIDTFPYASDTNASDVGDLSSASANIAGHSSSVSGYSSGLGTVGIDKFPFATRSNAASIGSISQARSVVTGTSSTTNGYTQGGYNFPNLSYNTIDRFPFATDASSSDVGDLTVARWGTAAQQY